MNEIGPSREPSLRDYVLIGNCRSAALLSRHGSIDWCCLPEFDSPAVFAALIDRQRGGYFSICPVSDYESSQHYIDETNVVETRFRTREGEVRLVDGFTAMEEDEKAHALFPDHEILRVIEGVTGTVKMRMECLPRRFYGKHVPVLQDRKKLGVRFSWNEHIYTLLTTLQEEAIQVSNEGDVSAIVEFDVAPGARLLFSLSYCNQSPAVLPELRITGLERMEKTIGVWKKWINKCSYSGIYSGAVKRSVLALKLLAYAPSGAIIAAPTTSLPEDPGGVRNWDYRYCWLRDASFTARVLVNLGFEEETHAYMNWILHTTRLTRPRLQVLYSVFGKAKLSERSLPWLSGYKNSKPVRIGNNAHDQFQLDVYGEVLDAAFTYAALVKSFDRDTRRFLIGLGKIICRTWEEPDNGIWEVRSQLVHHTHSKVMAWVGLDRIVKLCLRYNWHEAPVKRFRDTANRIKMEVNRLGYNREIKSYTRELNGTSLDASALTFSLVGFDDATSNRMMCTTETISRALSTNGLVYRYRDADDGMRGKEGAFCVCSFWLVENLARSGKLEEAMRVFETTLSHASPTGLLSEEIDPASGALLGNYPQGFSHIGLINAALTINEIQQTHRGAI